MLVIAFFTVVEINVVINFFDVLPFDLCWDYRILLWAIVGNQNDFTLFFIGFEVVDPAVFIIFLSIGALRDKGKVLQMEVLLERGVIFIPKLNFQR